MLLQASKFSQRFCIVGAPGNYLVAPIYFSEMPEYQR